MKILIYKNNMFYMSDIDVSVNSKTRILNKYIASNTNMPHTFFSKYIVIYGRKTCPYCIKTINLLSSYKNTLFVEIDTEPHELFNKQLLLKILQPEIKHHSTVPIIFDKCKFIGGSSDAETYFTQIKQTKQTKQNK